MGRAEEFAEDYQVPLPAVLEALDYVAQNRVLVEQERDREAARLRPRPRRACTGMKLLLDENMSDRRLAAKRLVCNQEVAGSIPVVST